MLGVTTSNCTVRRDLIDPVEVTSVLTAGLFWDRNFACRSGWLELNVVGHLSVEQSPAAAWVVESHFPRAITV